MPISSIGAGKLPTLMQAVRKQSHAPAWGSRSAEGLAFNAIYLDKNQADASDW